MTGLRFRAGDDAALAAAVIKVLSMPEALRRTMGRRGREWVLNHCQPAQVSAQILALYETVAPGGPGKSINR